MQSTWPWVLTFEYLSDRLKEVIEARSILIENGLLEAEYTWHTSLSLLGKGELIWIMISIFQPQTASGITLGKGYYITGRKYSV